MTVGPWTGAALLAASVMALAASGSFAQTPSPAQDSATVVELGSMAALGKMSGVHGFQVRMSTQQDDVDVDGQLITLNGVPTYKVRSPDGFNIVVGGKNINISRNNVNRNINVNNVNVNHNVNVNGGGYNNGGYHGGVYHPVAAGVAIGAMATAVGAAVSTRPAGCTPYNAYYQCGSVYHQPQHQADNVTYVQVNAPR